MAIGSPPITMELHNWQNVGLQFNHFRFISSRDIRDKYKQYSLHRHTHCLIRFLDIAQVTSLQILWDFVSTAGLKAPTKAVAAPHTVRTSRPVSKDVPLSYSFHVWNAEFKKLQRFLFSAGILRLESVTLGGSKLVLFQYVEQNFGNRGKRYC